MEHVYYTAHFVAPRAVAEHVADACAFQPLSSSVPSVFQPLFPEPHALVAVPASLAVLSL